MITVRLKGGLGNQMFQYAFAKSLAIKKKTNFNLDIRYLLDRTPIYNFVYRNYDLDIFNIENNFYLNRKLLPYEVYWDKLKFSILKHISKEYTSNYYVESDSEFNETFLDLPDDVYCNGYFQSYKYFDSIKDIITNDFTFRDSISNNCINLLDEIKNTNSVCMNFRRSDFVSNSFHDVIEKDYYSNSLKYLNDKFPDLHIYIFSDDIEWCKENLTFNNPYTFVGHQFAGEKFRSYLELMMECKHFIIPNSTFAWWAAYLSKNKKKIVITPKLWDKDGSKDDLIPDTWIRI